VELASLQAVQRQAHAGIGQAEVVFADQQFAALENKGDRVGMHLCVHQRDEFGRCLQHGAISIAANAAAESVRKLL
jgi:hypothetical protein